MLDLGTLKIGVTVDTAKATAQLSELKSTTAGTQKTFSNFGSKVGTLAKVGLTAIAAQAAAAGTALLATGKKAMDLYATYEQLEGGVETLFGTNGRTIEEYADSVGKSVGQVREKYNSLKKAQEIVVKNADDAWQTAGMSANDYMDTVTSFSAALITSCGGNTKEAAKQADQAITDMSDNANKMGTNLEDIQNAYKGFAKQNYTMLDNLKLGYGGTKTEMERLLKDAEKITGKKYDLSNLSDVYEAIHVIQDEWNITGTTAEEASTTIEGSVNSMKAAWDNWLTGLGRDDANMGKLTKNLMKSIVTAAKNIVPRIGKILGTIVEYAPKIGNQIWKAIQENLPSASDVKDEIQKKLEGALNFNISGPKISLDGIFTGLGTLGSDIQEQFKKVGDYLQNDSGIQGGLETIKDNFDDIKENSVDAAENILDYWDQLTPIIQPIGELFGDIATKIGIVATTIGSGLSDAFKQFSQFASDNIQPVVNTVSVAIETIKGIVDGVWQWIQNIITDLQNNPEFQEAFGQISEAVQNIWTNFQTIWPQIWGIVQTAISIIGGVIQTLLPIIQPIVEFIIIGITQLIATITGIISTVSNVVTTVISTVSGLPDAISGFIDNICKFFTETIPNAGKSVIKWFQSLPDKITSAIGDLSNTLTTAGEQIISGFLSGITSKFEEVKNFVGGIAGWIQEHKGPESYDKKLLVENGGWIMSGLQKGLEDSLPNLKKTLSDVTSLISGTKFDSSFKLANAASNLNPLPAKTAPAVANSNSTSPIYNIYINDAKINEDKEIESRFKSLMKEINRKNRM